jgi:ParB/RepB/Spo0J family partition protein
MARAKALDNDTLAVAAEVGEQLHIPPEDILVVPDDNVRALEPPMKYIEGLAQSIVDHTQLEPVLVRPIPAGEVPGPKFKLFVGYQRYKAVLYAREHLGAHELTVLARVVATEDELLLNLEEQLKRQDLTPLDLSRAIQRLKQAGRDGKYIGARLSKDGKPKSTSWVSQVGKFVSFRPHIQKMIHDGKLPMGYARELSGMEEAEQDDMLAKFEKGELKTAESMNTERRTKKKGKRDKRGRKAKAATPTLKAVVHVFEALAAPPEKAEKTGKAVKLTKDQEYRQTVAKIVLNFLSGKIGAGAVGRLIERIV